MGIDRCTQRVLNGTLRVLSGYSHRPSDRLATSCLSFVTGLIQLYYAVLRVVLRTALHW